MIRKILALCFLVVLLSSALLFVDVKADSPPSYDAEQIYELSSKAVFYIRILRSDDTVKATGTGVLLSADGTAATAYHVVKEAERIEGILYDGRVVAPIKVLKYDELTDAAILKLPAPLPTSGKKTNYESLSMRKPAVNYGETVFTIGYPIVNTPIIATGIVNNPKAKINGRDRILTSSQVVSGMSGGPMIDRQGRLAGIISGSLRTMDNIHLTINTEDIRSLLPNDWKQQN